MFFDGLLSLSMKEETKMCSPFGTRYFSFSRLRFESPYIRYMIAHLERMERIQPVPRQERGFFSSFFFSCFFIIIIIRICG